MCDAIGLGLALGLGLVLGAIGAHEGLKFRLWLRRETTTEGFQVHHKTVWFKISNRSEVSYGFWSGKGALVGLNSFRCLIVGLAVDGKRTCATWIE